MRLFQPRGGLKVDLDAPETYSHLPENTRELDELMFKLIGKALVYVKHFHPDWDTAQVKRVNKLIADFAENRQHNWQDLMWFREQVFLFENETENMC